MPSMPWWDITLADASAHYVLCDTSQLEEPMVNKLAVEYSISHRTAEHASSPDDEVCCTYTRAAGDWVLLGCELPCTGTVHQELYRVKKRPRTLLPRAIRSLFQQ